MKKLATLAAVSVSGLIVLTWSIILPVVGLLYLIGRLH